MNRLRLRLCFLSSLVWISCSSLSFFAASSAVAQTVNPPVIETRGYSSSLPRGSRFTLSPRFQGSSPITYQWYKNGIILADSTSDYLWLYEVDFSDAGAYHVVATNAAGSTTSSTWHLNILPELPPTGYPSIDPFPTKYLEPGQDLDIWPYTGSGRLPVTLQWYKDGQPLPGQTDDRLIVPFHSDIAGSYFLVETNDLGFNYHYVRDVAIGRYETTPLGGWSETLIIDQTVYFLFENPARIERFDLASGQFLAPISMPKSAQYFTVHENYFYYLSGLEIRRMLLDGNADELVATATFAPREIVAFSNHIYITGTSSQRETRVLNPTTRELTYFGLLDSFGAPVIADSATGVFIGRDLGYFTRYRFKTDGTVEEEIYNRHTRDFPGGSQTWLIQNATAVVANEGSIFDTSNLDFLSSFGSFADLSETSDGSLLILRGDSIERFDSNYHSLGQISLNQPAQGIASHGGRHFIFRQPSGPGTNLTAEEISLASFSHPRPSAPVDPTSLDLHIDDLWQDNRGDLLLHSRFHESVWIWSPTQARFIANIRLLNSATAVVYSPVWDRLLIGYPDGRINQIQLGGSTFSETPFARVPQQLLYLAAAGNHAMLTDPTGGWESYYIFDRDGQTIAQRELSQSSPATAWDPDENRILHLGSPSTNSALYATTINPDGSFGDQVSTDNHPPFGAPLLLSPQHDRVAVSNGVIFDAATLEPVGNLSSTLESGVWVGSKLFTAQTTVGGVQISRWDASSFSLENTVMVPGHSPSLFKTTDDQLVAVTESNAGIIFSRLDTDLAPFHRVSHRGANLLNIKNRLTNLSTRVNLPTDSAETLVAGFVIAGNDPLRVLVRAVGPTLSNFGVSQPLANPALQLFDAAQNTIGENDRWSVSYQENLMTGAFAELGAFPLQDYSTDAALLVTLDPGVYTVQVSRPESTGGTVLLELYDASGGASSGYLSNLSTRMRTGSGDSVLTAGFVMSGDVGRHMLIRAIGPGLSRFGVPAVLEDPLITIRQGNTVRAQNNDWAGAADIVNAAQQVGAFALESASSRDSALLINAPSGAYTAQVSGVDENAEGTALIEVYQIEN